MRQKRQTERAVSSIDNDNMQTLSGTTTMPVTSMDDQPSDRWRDLMTQNARERLMGAATQSRSVAGATRTRLTPYAEATQERLQRSREQLRRRQQQEQEIELEQQQRSLPVIPLVLVAIVAVVAVIAFLRSRGSEDDEMDEMDVLLDVGVSLSEMGEPGWQYVDDELIVAVEENSSSQ